MPLGYVLKTEQVLAYYGLERKDVAEAIFKYGVDRRVIMTTEPGALGGGGGQNGFRSPDDILTLAQEALEGMEGTVPRRYPSFHGTLARLPTDRRLMRRGQEGADLVMDIDVKGDYKEAFRDGRKILDFLDSYNAPYRVKFSGGSGPHIIIPYEAFPESLSGGRFDRAHKLLFQIITSRSRASHVDGSFTSTGHFYRIPYSLNEITGLVSLPLTREQYDDFTPSMAEAPNVQVDDNWFQEPDEEAREALMEIIRDNSGRSRDFADIVRPGRRSREMPGVILPGRPAAPQIPPDNIIQQIKDHIDIVDVISEYVPLTAAGKNSKGLCPFHEEKTPSFMVNRDMQIFKCFGCNEGGDVFTFLMKHEKMTYREAVRILAVRCGITIPETTQGDAKANLAAEELQKLNRNRFALEKMQKRIERQVQRLKRLGEGQAQEELIRKEEQKLREAIEKLEKKRHE